MTEARPRAYPLSNDLLFVQPSRGGQAQHSMADLLGSEMMSFGKRYSAKVIDVEQ